MRELIEAIQEADVFKPASKEEVKQRWDAAPTFPVVYKGDRDHPDDYDNFTLDKVYPAKEDPSIEGMLILKNDLGREVTMPSIDFDLSTPCDACGKNVFFEDHPEFNVCTECGAHICDDCSCPAPGGDFMCKAHRDEPVQEDNIFKPASKKEVEQRFTSQFKLIDSSKFKTAQEFIQAIDVPRYRLWSGGYVKAPGVWYDTYFTTGNMPGIVKKEHADLHGFVNDTSDLGHAVEIISDRKTGKLLAVWDLGDYESEEDAETELHSYSPEAFMPDLKSKGVVIKEADVFKPASQRELDRRQKEMGTSWRRIESVDQLQRLADWGVEVVIMLNGGARSTKYVNYYPEELPAKWQIENYIDDSVSTKLEDTNIPEAIEKGALWYDRAEYDATRRQGENEELPEAKDVFKPASSKDLQRRRADFKKAYGSNPPDSAVDLGEVWYEVFMTDETGGTQTLRQLNTREDALRIKAELEQVHPDVHYGVDKWRVDAAGTPEPIDELQEADVFKAATHKELGKRRSEYVKNLTKMKGKVAYWVDFTSWQLLATDWKHAEARAMEMLARGDRPGISNIGPVDEEDQQSKEMIEVEPVKSGKPKPVTPQMDVYYIDFSCWLIRADDSDMAQDKAEAFMRETLHNGTVPAISSVEPANSDLGDIAKGMQDAVTLMEAKPKKNVFQPASGEEVKQRRADYDKEQMAKAEVWVATAKRELEVALEVETSIEDEDNDRFTLSATPGEKGNNGESEWIVFQDSDSAEAYALERVQNDLENEPGSFSPEWLQTFITIDDTTRRIMAGEESDHYVDEQMEDDEILEAANVKDEYDEIQEQIDNLDSEAEDYDAQETALEEQKEKILEDAKETVREEKYEEIYEALDDPIQYFVHDQGMYSLEDLFKANFISIDYNEAAQSAIDDDGVAHFLDYYDGAEVELPSGAVAFGTN